MSLLTIDPACSATGPGCACAYFDRERLTGLFYSRPGDREVRAGTVVWEIPEVRPREDASPGKANTLIQLAAAGAQLAGECSDGDVVAVTPTKWKGPVAKPVQHGRVLLALAAEELAVVQLACGDDVAARVAAAKRAGGLDRWAKPGGSYYGRWTGHNLLDSVAIGLWALGRLPK